VGGPTAGCTVGVLIGSRSTGPRDLSPVATLHSFKSKAAALEVLESVQLVVKQLVSALDRSPHFGSARGTVPLFG
jgi:hypothetical protein